jgi:hypothetical protein
VALLTQLDAFYTEHRRCEELEAGVDGAVGMVCECSAGVARRDPAYDAKSLE